MEEIRPGDGKPWRQFDKPSSEILNTFDNPKPGRNYEILFKSREVTALCISGDSLIDVPRNLLEDPYGIPIKKLVGTEGYLYSYDVRKRRFVLSKYHSVRLTQRKAVTLKVIYALPTQLKLQVLYLTPDHLILLANGKYVRVQELQVNDRLVYLPRQIFSVLQPGQVVRGGEGILESTLIGTEVFNVQSGQILHHKDLNPCNNLLNNLELLSRQQHLILHKHLLYRCDERMTKEVLEDLYVRKLLPLREVARQLRADVSTVTTYLTKHGIKIRTLAEQNHLSKTILKRVKVGEMSSMGYRSGNHGAIVMGIKRAACRDVYNLEVEDTSNFVANGIVVHNCPLTGAPDFYTLSIKYIPHISCIESKSAKLYFGSWRNYGAFIETMANQIMDDWVKACKPVSAVLELTMAPRGGIPITVTVPYQSPV